MSKRIVTPLRPSTSYRDLALIVLLALIANTILAVVLPGVEVWGNTEVTRIAASIANGHGFSSPYQTPSGPSAWIPPVYPYLLAADFRLFGVFTATSYWIAVTFNIVVHALTCVLLYWTAGEVFGRRIGWYSALSLASLPLLTHPLVLLHLVRYSVQGSLMGLFISPRIIWYYHLTELALVLLIWLTLHPPHWMLNGAAWGAMALLNPTILILAPAFVGWRLWRRKDWRYIGLTITVAALCVTPWLARNYIVFHRLIFIRDNFGEELRVGNQPGSRGLWSANVHPATSAYELSRLVEMGEAQYNRVAGQEALHSILNHPSDFVRATIHRVGYFWLGSPMESRLGNLQFVKYLPALTFSLLAFYGAIRAVRCNNEKALLFVAVLLFYPLVHYLTQTSHGVSYQYLIQPEMIALATLAVSSGRWPAKPGMRDPIFDPVIKESPAKPDGAARAGEDEP